jgi:hypothetical protein
MMLHVIGKSVRAEEMIISHEHKFIFIKTQKCAGTSIELALSQICGPDDVITGVPKEDEKLRIGRGPQNFEIPAARRPLGWQLRQLTGRKRAAGTVFFAHMGAKAVRNAMDPALFDAYKKITVVRNPWDREVSLYHWAMRKKSKPVPFDDFVKRWNWRPERKTFDLYSIDGTIVAAAVLRYENLQDDFIAFVRTLGVEQIPEMPCAKGQYRPKASRNYKELYNDETKAIVQKRYRREIEAFGYEL